MITESVSHGRWIGNFMNIDFPVHIIQRNKEILAIKLIASDYVPEGEATWRLNLDTMECFGMVSEESFNKHREVKAVLTVLDKDRIRVIYGEHGDVVFRRDGI